MFNTIKTALDPKKTPSDEELQKISTYVFCRWLSGNPHTIKAANMFNRFENIPIENQYHVIKSAFAGKIKYIPYPKNIKEKKNPELEYLSKHFNISLEKAKEYLELISEEELNMIVEAYSSSKT